MKPPPIRYVDRRTGKLLTERVYAHRFLHWSHNSRGGRLLARLLFGQPVISRFYGWLQRRPRSRRRIRPFAASVGVRLAECTRPIDSYQSFNDFFTREIDLRLRPIARDPSLCVAPADGRVLALASVARGRTFQIKGATFNLDSFLDDPLLAQRFDNGAMLISRLHLADYHHFHFPVDCIPGESRPIGHALQTVAPYSLRWPATFYSENRRVLTPLTDTPFGTILMIEVGAFTVGSIQQRFVPGRRAEKGARKGYFELGGSTVVLLFGPGALCPDQDLCARSQQQLETYVQLGEPIGRLVRGGQS